MFFNVALLLFLFKLMSDDEMLAMHGLAHVIPPVPTVRVLVLAGDSKYI